ncbi:tail fiber domain-containing protein [Erwinia sp. MMLR14_017]|uniref:tail fiber domain-containing protein n=1 Tax=Erwinia sp. MMLR14_017 TaxID=3093842 RepID=UPI00298FD2A2|nr:tail fiber domain-containing protein [Erwinia sp. MMLR14_017]MDW8846608.1 tail fiber domain-containing protein [Erwinia sp. MMLR14_017]
MTANSSDVVWRVGIVPEIALHGGGIDIKAAGNIGVDRQIVSSFVVAGSWAGQYSSLASYYIGGNQTIGYDAYVPMLKQKFAMSGWSGAVSFGFVTPAGNANPDAAIHVIASKAANGNITFRFKSSGDIQTSKGLVAFAASDANLKTNINDVNADDAISRVEKLRPREFNWKGEGLPEDAVTREYRTRQRRGFIAQELNEVSEAYALPPIADDVPWGWEHSAVVADLVMYVRALKERTDQLEKEVSELKAAAEGSQAQRNKTT